MFGFRRAACAVAIAAMAAATHAQAGVVQVGFDDFHPDAGFIRFGEVPMGTTNPVYEPNLYRGGSSAPVVSFGGWFVGQGLSAQPATDCPGAVPTACIVGDPLGPLRLDPSSTQTFTHQDGSLNTVAALSGTPLFNGPISVLFSVDLLGVGFDAGYFDAIGSMGISAYSRSGALLGTVSNSRIGIEFLGLVSAGGREEIAGVQFELLGREPAGFAIDNLRFARLEQVEVPVASVGSEVPEPGVLWLLGAAVAAVPSGRRPLGARGPSQGRL